MRRIFPRSNMVFVKHGLSFKTPRRLQPKTRWLVSMSLVTVVGLLVATFWRPLQESDQDSLRKPNFLPPWREGMLDIHHLRVGPSETSFLVLPDGTTMLIDAGDIDLKTKLPALHARGHKGLKIRPPWPSEHQSTGQWTLEYMHHFWPRPQESKSARFLDYFLLTHFHCDHLGDPQPDSPNSTTSSYKRSGVTEVLSQLPARTIVDRGYPNYNVPHPLLAEWNNVANYRLFLQHEHQGQVQAFVVGSTSQFKLQQQPLHSHYANEFTIYNLKSNRQVVSEWKPGSGDFQDRTISTIPGNFWKDSEQTKWDENEFSTAILLQYGDFHYYEGGDQETHGDFDAVTPTAQAAGWVDVATANHHGRGTNAAFCQYLDPSVVILQGLFSDQPLAKTMDFLMQPESTGELRTLLVTDVFPERLEAIGRRRAEAFAGMNGHVVVRVDAPGPKQRYSVYMLNEDRKVTRKWGPFKPRERG